MLVELFLYFKLFSFDLGWVEYVTLRYVISVCTGRLV